MKFFKEIHSLLWTIAGTALVLITLSGQVRTYALWISGATLVLHLIGALASKDE